MTQRRQLNYLQHNDPSKVIIQDDCKKLIKYPVRQNMGNKKRYYCLDLKKICLLLWDKENSINEIIKSVAVKVAFHGIGFRKMAEKTQVLSFPEHVGFSPLYREKAKYP